VAVGQTVDIGANVAALPAGTNLQFTSITISGTLLVPSGTILRATGNVSITGAITVEQSVSDIIGQPHPGFARSSAGLAGINGGRGLTVLQAAGQRVTPIGGGSGARGPNAVTGSGGEGGGSFAIYAAGSITVSVTGAIRAIGANGINPQTAGAGIVGTGGGGGGLIRLAAKGSLTVGGLINVSGGNAADGFNGNGGSGDGGGGGGGGGIVHLLATSTPSVTGSIVVNGGSPGGNAAPTTGIVVNVGGGGGASGGNGGSGGTTNSTVTITPSAGAAGHSITNVVPAPENLVP
jgi:hypothetical protein